MKILLMVAILSVSILVSCDDSKPEIKASDERSALVESYEKMVFHSREFKALDGKERIEDSRMMDLVKIHGLEDARKTREWEILAEEDIIEGKKKVSHYDGFQEASVRYLKVGGDAMEIKRLAPRSWSGAAYRK